MTNSKNTTSRSRLTWAIAWLGLGSLVFVSLACTVHARPATVAPAAIAEPAAEPLVCSGSEDLSVSDREIRSAGDGVVVAGSCNIRLRNVSVVADGCAIRVRGAGDVDVAGSELQGAAGAVCIEGSGDVVARDSHFVGRIHVSGAGDMDDAGGNQFDR